MYSWIAYNLLCKEHLIGKYYRSCLIIYAGKLYMIRYGTGQIFWKSHLSVNWTRNIKSKKIQSNVTLRSNWDMFLFSFVFPALEAPYSKFKKTAIPKYLPFSLPYPGAWEPGGSGGVGPPLESGIYIVKKFLKTFLIYWDPPG